MSRVVLHRDRPFWPSYVALLLFILILTSMTLQRVVASPLWDPTQKNETSTSKTSTENSIKNWMDNSANSSMDDSMDSSTDNSTEISPTDVYVIKAVVYEIGILADTDNTTISGESTERQERVDISLYSAPQDDEFS